MFMKKIHYLFLFLIYAQFTFAQTSFQQKGNFKDDFSHWSLTLEGGMNQFDGDMNQSYNDVVPNAHFKLSFGGTLEYTITPVWGLGLEYYNLPLSATNGLGNYFTSSVNHYNAYFTINFLNLLATRIDTRWGLWATVGGGLATYNSFFYNNDVLESTIKNGLAIVVPVGVLVEYNYSKSLAFGAKLQYRSHNKDNLEGDPRYNYAGVTNDFISLGTASVRWKFRAKNRQHVRNMDSRTFSPEEAMIPARQAKAKADSLQTKVDSLRNEVDVMKPKIDKIENILAIGTPIQKPIEVVKKPVVDDNMLNKFGDDDRDGVENYRDHEPRTSPNKPVDYWGVTIRGVNINGFGTVYFGFDKVDLDAEAMDMINIVAQKIMTDPSLFLEVRGFADNVGNVEYNQKLSQRRAEVVKSVIVKKYGVSPDRIVANGKGKIIDVVGANRMNRRCNFYFSD